MGSGLHKQQEEERSNQGKKLSGSEEVYKDETSIGIKIGKFTIIGNEKGYKVISEEGELGPFREGEIHEDRAIFRLDKGMMLEVTENKVREIFSPEKAELHGYICADGYIRCGKCGSKYRYEVRLYDQEYETAIHYANIIEKIYGVKAHYYPKYDEIATYGREVAEDLNKYRPYGTEHWRVPFKFLDRNSARSWLRGFFDGDGDVNVRRSLSKSAVRAFSKNKEGLLEVKKLLEQLGIKSYFSKRTNRIEYELDVQSENIKKFAELIGFNSPKKRQKLNLLLKLFFNK